MNIKVSLHKILILFIGIIVSQTSAMRRDVLHTTLSRTALTSCNYQQTPHRGIGSIADGTVLSDLSISAPQRLVDRTMLIPHFNACINQSKRRASELLNEVWPSWTNGLNLTSRVYNLTLDFVRQRLLLPRNMDASRSLEQGTYLHKLLQISIFVLFLEEQDNDVAAYGPEVTATMTSLKGYMLQVACAARSFLAHLTDIDIMAAVGQNVNHTLSLASVASKDMRRRICVMSLSVMVDELTFFGV